MAEKEENLHKQHRQRMKNRFLNEGLEKFEQHNILELLLFFAIPQADTNEQAHRLLNTFGSISSVFNAPYDELVKVRGIGDHAATLIKLIPELLSVYVKDKTERAGKKAFTVDDAAKYLIPYYFGCQNEVVRALYFDNGMNLMDNIVIFEGDVNSAKLSYGDIARLAIMRGYPNIIVAHNHPNGAPIPSLEDNETTSVLLNSLNMLNINLIEHIIISDNQYTKILELSRKTGKIK